MKNTKLYFLLLFSMVLLYSACDDDEPGTNKTDNFNRQQMLAYLADTLIVPAFEAYDQSLDGLVSAKNDFISNGHTEADFDALRASWLTAYKAWQWVSMYEIGKAEEIGLRNFTNIFPCDAELIRANITSGSYNLELPSNFDAQGFPALDYMLYGIAADKAAILASLAQSNHSDYLSATVDRLKSLSASVLNDWQNGYRDDFVANDGASATAATDKLVNDYLFYYEKFLRAGKIGIPAGVFSGSSIATAVEAPYSAVYSKDLFAEGFNAVQAFFKGIGFDPQYTGTSLKAYLEYVRDQNNTDDIAQEIIDQWQIADQKIQALDANFQQQITDDNLKMLEAYDELQKAVVVLKVDMMQALNIQVDYVDADGD